MWYALYLKRVCVGVIVDVRWFVRFFFFFLFCLRNKTARRNTCSGPLFCLAVGSAVGLWCSRVSRKRVCFLRSLVAVAAAVLLQACCRTVYSTKVLCMLRHWRAILYTRYEERTVGIYRALELELYSSKKQICIQNIYCICVKQIYIQYIQLYIYMWVFSAQWVQCSPQVCDAPDYS